MTKDTDVLDLSLVLGAFPLGQFRPVATIIPGMDMLLYVEKDCSWEERPIPGTNIVLLYDPREPDRVVGVQIHEISVVAKDILVHDEHFGAR